MFRKLFGRSPKNSENEKRPAGGFPHKADEMEADFRLRCREYDAKCEKARALAESYKALKSSGASAGKLAIEERQLNRAMDAARTAYRRVTTIQENLEQHQAILDATQHRIDLDHGFEPRVFLDLEADINRLRDAREEVREASRSLTDALAADDELSAEEIILPEREMTHPERNRSERDLDRELDQL